MLAADLKETVLIPDFTFRHPDGRIALLEIMGYWRPEYLKRELDKLRRAQRKDLIVAVSSNFNISEDDFKDVPGGVFFFICTKSSPKTSEAYWIRSHHPHPDPRPPCARLAPCSASCSCGQSTPTLFT